MNEYTFEVNAGAVQDERKKSHWPDVLTVWMPRWWAWLLLHQLVNQLEEGKSRVEFQFTNCGKMTIEDKPATYHVATVQQFREVMKELQSTGENGAIIHFAEGVYDLDAPDEEKNE